MQIKRMNWFQKKPLWQVNQAWRQRRAAMRTEFEAQTAALVNSFNAASTNQINGLAQIAAQAGSARITDQVSAKIKQLVNRAA